jgi:hypothetical protein
MLDARYTNQGAIRNQKVKKSLFDALDKVSKEFGMDFEIYSGGQPAKGSKGKRVGSTAHDNHGDGGGAGDVKFLKNGKAFDLESDPKIKTALAKRLKEEGVNQFGYGKGYMQGTTTMHLGMDDSGITKVWGADKTRKTADPLLASTLGQTMQYIPKNNFMPIREQAMARVNQEQLPFVDNKGSFLPMTPKDKTEVKGAEYQPMQVVKNRETGTTDTKTKPRLNLGDGIPYLSNLYNMTQKPAAVPRPVLNAPVQLERISMDNDRYEVNKDYRALQQNFDQTLDANTATYAKLAGKAGKFQKLSAVNQAERNQNREISNQETSLNTAIAQGNNDKVYQTRMLEAERENVMTSQRMGNLSNLTDKYTAQQNTKAKNDLEEKRIQFQLDTDPYGTLAAALAKKKENKKYGGPMSGTVFNTLKKIR